MPAARTQSEWRKAATLGVAAFFASCGGRTSIHDHDDHGFRNDDYVPSGGGTGGGAPSGGGSHSVGGSPPLGSGGLLNGAGGEATTGGDSSSGGAPAVGGASTGGADMGGAGSGGSVACDPALQCRGYRPYYLIFGAYGRQPIRPEVAGCVDYNEDEWLDVFDYLTLIESWGENCPEEGELSEPGACLFPGDIDGNGCLDLAGDYKSIEVQRGQLASESSICADTNDDGRVDDLDLAYVASRISMLGCEDLDLNPENLIDGDPGVAMRCGDAPVGDVNEDEAIDYRDLYAILSHLGLDVAAPAECIDLNGDQTIDLADLLHYFERGAPYEIEGCPDAPAELESFVDENKACAVDSDCSSFPAGCSHVAEHCSRVVYLNSASDETRLSELVGPSAECMWASGCRSCSSTPPAPRCLLGRCSPEGH